MAPPQAAGAPEGTVLFLLDRARSYLSSKGVESARLDAELLLGSVLGTDRLTLYLRFDQELESEQIEAYRQLIRRRVAGQPTAYLTGCREFWSLDFEVNPDVLVPRPESELLIETALELAGSSSPDLVLDLGTGAGNLAVALAREWPQARVVGVDSSIPALELAARNAVRHGVRERIWLVGSDCLSGFVEEPIFSMMVTNPPYIPTAELEMLPAEVRCEPRGALDGGDDGLLFFRLLAGGARQLVKRGGWLLAEAGQGQAAAVRDLWAAAGFTNLSSRRDLAGIERVVAARVD